MCNHLSKNIGNNVFVGFQFGQKTEWSMIFSVSVHRGNGRDESILLSSQWAR